MTLFSIVLLLQLSLSLLGSINPSTPNYLKQQALDFSYRAVETASLAITTITVPQSDELGIPIKSVEPIKSIEPSQPLPEITTDTTFGNQPAMTPQQKSFMLKMMHPLIIKPV